VNSGFVHADFFDGINNQLVILMSDIHTQRLELSNQFPDSIFVGIPSFVSQILELSSTQHLEDGSGKTVCNCNLRLVRRTSIELKFCKL
jgi:hypothetical protein